MGELTPLEAERLKRETYVVDNETISYCSDETDADDDDELYTVLADARLKCLFEKYFPIFDSKTITHKYIDIHVSALHYIPLIEFNDLFKQLVELYNEIIQGCTTFRSYAFLLLSLHINGIFAINPSYVWLMWSETICNDLVLLINSL